MESLVARVRGTRRGNVRDSGDDRRVGPHGLPQCDPVAASAARDDVVNGGERVLLMGQVSVLHAKCLDSAALARIGLRRDCKQLPGPAALYFRRYGASGSPMKIPRPGRATLFQYASIIVIRRNSPLAQRYQQRMCRARIGIDNGNAMPCEAVLKVFRQ